MTKDNATPRPWKLVLPIVEDEDELTEEGGMVAIFAGDRITSPGDFTVGNEIVLDSNCIPGENKIAEANARLIVKAVNEYDRNQEIIKEQNETIHKLTVCHDDLVEALKSLEQAVLNYVGFEVPETLSQDLKIAKQALEKASQ